MTVLLRHDTQRHPALVAVIARGCQLQHMLTPRTRSTSAFWWFALYLITDFGCKFATQLAPAPLACCVKRDRASCPKVDFFVCLTAMFSASRRTRVTTMGRSDKFNINFHQP